MKTFKEWLKEMAGTGAIYNGEPAQVSNKGTKHRDYNWWGAPETAGMSQEKAHDEMEKDFEKPKKKKHKGHHK